MGKWLKFLTKLKLMSGPTETKYSDNYGLDNLEDEVIGYPPNPRGIPVIQNQVWIDCFESDINFLKSELGLSKEEFDKYITPAIINFITFADLLTASEYKHHSTGGGLVYHSLDVAKRAMRESQHTHFPVGIGTLADTQQSNMQWKSATVLAALMHDSGKILADMVVSDGSPLDEEIVWNAHESESINQWAQKHNINRYYVRWNRDRHQKHKNASITMMQRLIPTKTWSWIDSCFDGKAIHHAMLEGVASNNLSHPLSKIIAQCDAESVRKDMFNRNSHVTREMKKNPLSEILADLMKHHIITDLWDINRKNAKVWYVDNALYLSWRAVVPELVEEMGGAGYKIPEVPEVLARLMTEEGMAEQNGDELFFDIYPEILGDKKHPVKLTVLKIRRPERILLDIDKIWSIGQHTVKATVAPDTAMIAKDGIETNETESTGQTQTKSQSKFESSRMTVKRVLAFMKQPKVAAKEQQEVFDTVAALGAAFIAENLSEPTHEANTESEQPGDQIKDVKFAHPIPAFIYSYFDFEVANEIIQVPKSEMEKVIKKIVDFKINGEDEFSAFNTLDNLAEVNIYEQ